MGKCAAAPGVAVSLSPREEDFGKKDSRSTDFAFMHLSEGPRF